MKFFIDTAKVEDIKAANDMGIICGGSLNLTANRSVNDLCDLFDNFIKVSALFCDQRRVCGNTTDDPHIIIRKIGTKDSFFSDIQPTSLYNIEYSPRVIARKTTGYAKVEKKIKKQKTNKNK